MERIQYLLAIVLVALLAADGAYYLPGVTPQTFQMHEKVIPI